MKRSKLVDVRDELRIRKPPYEYCIAIRALSVNGVGPPRQRSRCNKKRPRVCALGKPPGPTSGTSPPYIHVYNTCMKPKRSPRRVKEPVQVYLDATDRQRLEDVVEKTGLSRAEILRRGLRGMAERAKRTTKYVAFDLHQATTVASVRDDSGRVIARSVLETRAPSIVEFPPWHARGDSRRLRGGDPVAVVARANCAARRILALLK